MTLPNFLIIGAAKCATTSLASLLDLHPQAAIVKGKEPHFFSYDPNYANGIEHYKSRFSHCENELAIGDASTSYSRLRQHPQVIERIATHLGQPKIIYMVRHPIERIESAYIEQMTEPQNAAITSINQAVVERPMMVDSSRYWETYIAYRKFVGEAKIHVVWFDEYVNNINGTYAGICDFLEIDNTFIPNLKSENANSRSAAQNRLTGNVTISSQWNRSTLRKIKQLLKKDNQKFLLYFNKPFDYWK